MAIHFVLQLAQALATYAIDLGVVIAVRQDAHLSLLLVVSMPLMLLAVTLLMSRTVPYFHKMQGQMDCLRRSRQYLNNGKRILLHASRVSLLPSLPAN